MLKLGEALLNIENSSSKFSLKYPLIVHCDCQCWNKGRVKKWKFRMAFAMKGGGRGGGVSSAMKVSNGIKLQTSN